MKHIDEHLAFLEADSSIFTRRDAFRRLAELGIGDFATVLWRMPDDRFPRLSSMLPAMASDEVQDSWTGSHGDVLLGQSLEFVRALSQNYLEITGQRLRDKRICDFGCGYGRFLRMLSFYTNEIYGVDPWNQSIEICNAAGLTDRVYLSDYIPSSLPVPTGLDLVFAFSVFTHLSERATLTCLRTLREYVAPDGVVCITIRPVEYWRLIYPHWLEEQLAQLERQHDAGFAFVPHLRETVDGEVTYGDTSMSIGWLRARCQELGWRIQAVDRSVGDPLQRYVFLQRQ